jgi:2-polyprenyl-3-methyl-5-hydroxy-6-metoxy-1,4-benzoquinol methylase
MIDNDDLSKALKARFKHLTIPYLALLKTVYRPYYGPIKDLINIFERSKNCLEIGCGMGPITFSLYEAKLIDTITGFDIDKASLDIARSAVRAGEKIEFNVNEDFKNIDFTKFDTIVLFDLLHHLRYNQQLSLLSKIFKQSKVLTKIYIKDLNPRPYIKAIFNRLTDYISTKSSVNYISTDSIVNIANSHGLKIVFLESNFNSLWSHYLIKLEKK